MNLTISTFLTPKSQRTRDGIPYIWTASWKQASAVSARLLFKHLKNVTSLEKPSIPERQVLTVEKHSQLHTK